MCYQKSESDNSTLSLFINGLISVIMWCGVVAMVVWIMSMDLCVGGDPCVLQYGCRCLQQYSQIECRSSALTFIPAPYRYAYMEYGSLDLRDNNIHEVRKYDFQQWEQLQYMDLRGNPLSPRSCAVVRQFVQESGRAVQSNCRCVVY